MQKHTKRLIALFCLAVLLVSSLSLGVAAADPGQIVINNTTAGKTYEAYRIFDVTYSTVGGQTLYTYTINSDFAAFFQTEYGKTKNEEAVAIVSAMTDNSDELNAFAAKAKEYALVNNIAPVYSGEATGDTMTITNLPLGYYLVYPQGGLTAACSLTTTNPTGTVNVKTTYPEIEKKIVEDTKHLDNTTGMVGDVVNFELTSKVPDMTGYSKYTYIVNDRLSAGLTFNDDVAISVGSIKLKATDFEVKQSTVGGATNITIEFKDFLTQYASLSGETIVITYSATINQNAVIGDPGNTNSVNLTYSNDPHDETSTDKTPDDKVTVFSFELDAVKVDAADPTKPLQGAVFSLWTTTPVTGAQTKDYTDKGGNKVTLYQLSNSLTSDIDGKFSHSVKAGTYYLFEETAPTGYNPMTDPIVFTVTPVIDATTNTLTGLTIDNASLSSVGGTGAINTTIENSSGLLLPSTGGIGITLFVFGGGALMAVSAAAYFYSRKKNAKTSS